MDRRRISRINFHQRSRFFGFTECVDSLCYDLSDIISDDLQDDVAVRRVSNPHPLADQIAPQDHGVGPARDFPRDSMEGILYPV